MHRPSFLIPLLLFTGTSCLDISISLTAPQAAVSVSPSLVSLSIEQDRWTDWVGTTSRNDFFFNALDNYKQFTGEVPQIRIGANSEDHTNFNPDVEFAQLIFPAPSANVPYPEATNMTVGDGYYATAQFLPPKTHVIWGLNFGQNNLTSTFLNAKALVKAFALPAIKDAGITLDAIEIGNEPDVYGRYNDARPPTYTVTQYVKEWIAFAENVTAAVNLTSTSPTKFWGLSLAGIARSSGWTLQAIFDQGILASAPGSLISTISQHWYSGACCSGSAGNLQDLMTKSMIRSNLTLFAPDIAATRARGLDYVLGETNSNPLHGAPGVSNTAGAALWTLDYLLYATQIGISRVFFHQGIGYKYNLIQPATLTRSTLDGSPLPAPLPPHIQPQYYAAIIAAEAIGASGKTCVVELSIDHPRVAGYAFYEDGMLARALLINSQGFFVGDTQRESVHVDLGFVSSGAGPNVPGKMTVKRLFAPHADDTTGLTWGGQTYETSDARVDGELKVEAVDVLDGVDIQETEVVLLSFK